MLTFLFLFYRFCRADQAGMRGGVRRKCVIYERRNRRHRRGSNLGVPGHRARAVRRRPDRICAAWPLPLRCACRSQPAAPTSLCSAPAGRGSVQIWLELRGSFECISLRSHLGCTRHQAHCKQMTPRFDRVALPTGLQKWMLKFSLATHPESGALIGVQRPADLSQTDHGIKSRQFLWPWCHIF